MFLVGVVHGQWYLFLRLYHINKHFVLLNVIEKIGHPHTYLRISLLQTET